MTLADRATTRTRADGSCYGQAISTWVIGATLLFPEVSVQAQPTAAPPPATNVQPAASPLLTEPTAPAALFDAVVLMIDLARPELARTYLDQLLAQNPDDTALLAMRDKHGPAVFLRLANLESLQPGSATLLDRMNAAFRRFAADTARIDGLIAELAGAPSVRDAAILQLRSGGALVVPRLVERIGDVKDPATRELLTYTLTRLGFDVIPPVRAVLNSNNANMRTMALEVLGRLGSPDTVVYLWHFAVDGQQPPGVRVAAAEAVSRLTLGSARHVGQLSRGRALAGLERGARVRWSGGGRPPAGADGQVTSWSWNNQEGRLESGLANPDEVALHEGLKMAQQALSLSPENRRLQALVVSLMLTRARVATPWTEGMPRGVGTAFDAALLSGGAVVTASLQDALDSGNATSAVASLEVLRQLATRHDLVSGAGRRSAIVAAMNYPDPRVQFTAAMAVVETDPKGSFRGKSRVVQVLAQALVNDDTRRVVLAGPKPTAVSALAGLFDQVGYRSLIAASGRDAFREAAARGDVGLVVLDVNVIGWSLSQTVANLRADARTAATPIVVVGDDRRVASVERMRSRDRLMSYMQRPANVRGLNQQVGPFLTGVRTESLSAAERGVRAASAIDLLGYLADGRRSTVFDLRPAEAGLHEAIQNDALANGAVYALGSIATASAQDRLATTALQPDLNEETRERAAALCAFHMQKHGVLLDAARIGQLRQGHAEETSASVKSSLAAVLGALKPTAMKVGSRLQSVPNPPPR